MELHADLPQLAVELHADLPMALVQGMRLPGVFEMASKPDTGWPLLQPELGGHALAGVL